MRRGGMWQVVHQKRRVDEAQENSHRATTTRLRDVRKMFRQERSPKEAHEDPRKSRSVSLVSVGVQRVWHRSGGTTSAHFSAVHVSHLTQSR